MDVGSPDPDNGALSYDWDFGDGSLHATVANPSHVYTAAGSYVARLRVTDPSGASDTAEVGINVLASTQTLHIRNIVMTLTIKRSSAQTSASVSVLDSSGKAIPGATVTGKWSGVVSGNSSGITGTGGTVKLGSPSTKKSGTFTFTVTGVTFSGYAYDAGANTETADSITH